MVEKKKYWYKFYEDFCPLCMRTEVEKVRVYDEPKPKEWHKRHIEAESVCISHFL